MSYKIEKLSSHLAILGEGPHWDIEKQSLYYVDIVSGTIHRYSYEEDKVYTASIDNEKSPSFIIPVENEEGRFAVGLERRVGVINWDGRSPKATVERIVFEIETDDSNKDCRINDGKADPSGRLVTGTMRNDFQNAPQNPIGNLYMYSKANKLTHIRSEIGISNGLAWNEKAKKMYYIDSLDLRVREFNYDISNGKIDEARILIDFHDDNNEKQRFVPDGMTIDSEGFLYVAGWGSSKILKINSVDGKVAMSIDVPCQQVTSCAFGGPNLDILFITTAAFGDKPSPAGATFKVTGLGAKGLPMQKVQL